MEYTPNNFFPKPPYRESGPTAYNAYNAALDATDAFLQTLVPLPDLINNWAIEDQIVTMIPVTCTYSDADTFTLPGDYTSRFAAGAVVQVQVAAGMAYSTVASSSYAAPTTTVNLSDTVLTDPITRVYVVATRDGLWPNGPGYVVARDYGTDRAALETADAVAAAADKELRITYAYTIDDDVTLAAPMVTVQPGVPFAVATTKTLTINGSLDAGLYQIFSCTGTGKVVFAAGSTVYSGWFADLATAIACIGSVDTRLEITETATISDDMAINVATNLVIPPGNVLTIAVGKTLTINGTLDAGPYQIFDGAGTIVYGSLVYIKYGEWKGDSGVSIESLEPSKVGIKGQASNLQIQVTSNTEITVTADEVVLEDPDNKYKTVRTVDIDIDTAVSGAGGLDTGTVAVSTWYAVHAAYNPTTDDLAGLLSLSATAPTLPDGYTYAARLGWVRADASANLLRTIQKDKSVQYINTGTGLPTMASGVQGNISTPTWVAVAVGNFVPPTAAQIIINYALSDVQIIVAPNNSYGGWGNYTNSPLLYSISVALGGVAALMLESTNIYYASNNANAHLFCYGWIDNL